MFNKWKEKKKNEKEAVNRARNEFIAWCDTAKTEGWKVYESKIDKSIENIKERILTDTSLSPEDLKRLQLALQVWRLVKNIPKELEDKAKGGNVNEQ